MSAKEREKKKNLTNYKTDDCFLYCLAHKTSEFSLAFLEKIQSNFFDFSNLITALELKCVEQKEESEFPKLLFLTHRFKWLSKEGKKDLSAAEVEAEMEGIFRAYIKNNVADSVLIFQFVRETFYNNAGDETRIKCLNKVVLIHSKALMDLNPSETCRLITELNQQHMDEVIAYFQRRGGEEDDDNVLFSLLNYLIETRQVIIYVYIL